MATKVTHFATPPDNMWLYLLKEWMERKEIQMTWNPQTKLAYNAQTTTGQPIGKYHSDDAIIDVIQQKKHKKEAWQWLNKMEVWTVSDLINPDGHSRLTKSMQTYLQQSLNLNGDGVIEEITEDTIPRE